MLPYAAKRALKHGITNAMRLTRARGARTVILCYHSINQADSYMSIDPAAFRAQLTWLKDRGFRFLTIRELASSPARPDSAGPTVVLTFDDGFADNLTSAAAIMADLDVSGTVFITAGLCQGDLRIVEPMRKLTGYDQPFLTPPQIRQLHAAGIEVAAHTHTHSNLALLGEDRLRRELTMPKAWLEDTIGAAVTSFAYPFGKRHIHYTRRAIHLLPEAGYTVAAAVAFGPVRATHLRQPFELPRIFLTREDTIDSFGQKVEGDWDWLGVWQRATPRWLKGMVSPRDRYPYVIDV